jgi:predicted enzyme related to lactoylglutathione lyase
LQDRRRTTNAQLRAGGVTVDPKVEDFEGIGRFGWAMDCDGNRFELFEPAKKP